MSLMSVYVYVHVRESALRGDLVPCARGACAIETLKNSSVIVKIGGKIARELDFDVGKYSGLSFCR